MAGQFDDLLKVYNPDSKPVTGPWKKGQKLVKNLGVGANPDTVEGTWTGENEQGGPKGTKVKQTVYPALADTTETDTAGKDTNITQAAVNVAQGRRADLASRDLELNRGELRRNARKRQIKGLSTTTMRLDEKTGEAYDTEDVKSFTSGRVMPTRQSNPKYRAADVQRENEDRDAWVEADRKRNNQTEEKDPTGESAFNAGEKSKGSSLRSINGVTFDLEEYKASLPNKRLVNFPAPYDISEFDPSAPSSPTPSSPTPTDADRLSTIVPTKPLNTKMVDNRESEMEPEETADETAQRIQRNVVREYEQKSKGKTEVEYGDTLSEKNKKTIFKTPSVKETVERTTYKRPEKMYVEEDPDKMFGHLTDEQYDFRAEEADALSTTMREVQPEGPAQATTRKVQIRRPGVAAPFDKPAVSKRGNVIPQSILDTYTGNDVTVDEEQAKRDRQSRTPLTSTGPYDPNKTPGRDSFGRTPERRAVQAAIREERAAALAAEGMEMTTVQPHIMQTAKALAATSRFGFQKNDPFFDTTQFLDHPAIQEATIAHAFGVHHDISLLHRALGGRAPEIARRRNAWFKVADRKLRGNPESNMGEYSTLEAAIRKGKAPGTVTRKLERGQKPGITINGQVPTLAPAAPVADVKSPTRAGTRAMHDNTATNIAYQLQQAAKEAHRIMTFTPLKTTTMRLNEATGEAYDMDNKDEALKNAVQSSGETTPGIAPAGSDFVTVRNKNNPDAAPVTRPFTEAERLNKGNVPDADDSKRRV
jgi:hypothetical protein